MANPFPGRVLVTGSSGRIGNAVVNALHQAGCDVVPLDNRLVNTRRQHPTHPLPTRFASIAERHSLFEPMAGVDQVVHLAANPSPNADLRSQLIEPNIIGLENVLEVAAQTDVRRVILASSILVASKEQRPAVPSLAHQRPDNWYAITKVVSEHAGALYHRNHGLDVIAARIGRVADLRERDEERQRRIIQHTLADNEADAYLSFEDVARFFLDAVSAEWSGFHVLNVMSSPQEADNPTFDLNPTRELVGFTPKDTFPAPLNHSA